MRKNIPLAPAAPKHWHAYLLALGLPLSEPRAFIQETRLRFPDTTGDLLRQLEELFPETAPKPGDSPEKIFHAAGQRSVVLFLKNWRENAGKSPPQPRLRGVGRPV